MDNVRQKYHVPASESTPEVLIDFSAGIFSLSGRSVIHHEPNFYQDFLEAVKCYCAEPLSLTTVNINLEYFGDESAKRIVEFLKLFESIHRKKSEVLVKWYFSKGYKVMQSTAEDFENIISLPFQIIEQKDDF
jgi:hypothetical protein